MVSHRRWRLESPGFANLRPLDILSCKGARGLTSGVPLTAELSMPADHLLISVLLLAVVVLLVTEWIPLEATALLTLVVFVIIMLAVPVFWSLQP